MDNNARLKIDSGFKVYDPITKKIYPVNDINYWLEQVNCSPYPADKEKYPLVDLGEGGVLIRATGRKDKNNNPIYEGDIISYYKTLAKVEWREESCGFTGVYLNYRVYNTLLPPYNWGDAEVIGNIYENFELTGATNEA
jgi:hypothetical protein